MQHGPLEKFQSNLVSLCVIIINLHPHFRLSCTLQAEATFSLYELPTTVQIRPEVLMIKLKKGFFLFLTGLGHCLSLA